MRRGEIWWANMPLPAGRRPVVLVSRDAAYAVRASVTVIEVSTRLRGIASEVPLGRRDGLPKSCVANADNLVTIPKTWLESSIAPLRHDKVQALDAALRFALGLETTGVGRTSQRSP
jgi:mRNA interferase MazF